MSTIHSNKSVYGQPTTNVNTQIFGKLFKGTVCNFSETSTHFMERNMVSIKHQIEWCYRCVLCAILRSIEENVCSIWFLNLGFSPHFFEKNQIMCPIFCRRKIGHIFLLRRNGISSTWPIYISSPNQKWKLSLNEKISLFRIKIVIMLCKICKVLTKNIEEFPKEFGWRIRVLIIYQPNSGIFSLSSNV